MLVFAGYCSSMGICFIKGNEGVKCGSAYYC